eukprot:6251971-Pyramimonas_sp.AAC.1
MLTTLQTAMAAARTPAVAAEVPVPPEGGAPQVRPFAGQPQRLGRMPTAEELAAAAPAAAAAVASPVDGAADHAAAAGPAPPAPAAADGAPAAPAGADGEDLAA